MQRLRTRFVVFQSIFLNCNVNNNIQSLLRKICFTTVRPWLSLTMYSTCIFHCDACLVCGIFHPYIYIYNLYLEFIKLVTVGFGPIYKRTPNFLKTICINSPLNLFYLSKNKNVLFFNQVLETWPQFFFKK